MKHFVIGKIRTRPARRRKTPTPRGFSLLEVMLALAILGISIAAMGELVRLGTRAAAETRDLTKAQILCEGMMSELAAGVTPPESVDRVPFELDPEWNYSIVVGAVDQEGLLLVQVTVEQEVETGQQPLSFTLTRWMVDPLLEQTEDSDTILGGESTTEGSATTESQSGALP